MRFGKARFDSLASNGGGGLWPALHAAAVPCLLAAQGVIDEEDFNDLLFWGGLLIVSMLVLFVVQKVIRFGIQSRVRSIHRQFGIRPDDLDEMTRTGLLTEEEKKKIQEAIKRNLLKESQDAVKSQTKGRVSAEDILKTSLGKPGSEGKAERGGEASRVGRIQPRPSGREGVGAPEHSDPSAGQVDSTPAGLERDAPAGPGTGAAVDLEALLRKGLITPEEYERLRSGREPDI